MTFPAVIIDKAHMPEVIRVLMYLVDLWLKWLSLLSNSGKRISD